MVNFCERLQKKSSSFGKWWNSCFTINFFICANFTHSKNFWNACGWFSFEYISCSISKSMIHKISLTTTCFFVNQPLIQDLNNQYSITQHLRSKRSRNALRKTGRWERNLGRNQRHRPSCLRRKKKKGKRYTKKVRGFYRDTWITNRFFRLL